MAWVAPRTWTAGQTVTAAQLNVDIRDNSKALGDPWTAYTPTWDAVTTNPTLGNGTLVGAYVSFGKLTFFRIVLTFGSTTTVGSGVYHWTIPVNSSVGSPLSVGTGTMLDNSANDTRSRGARLFAVGKVMLTNTDGTDVGHAVPFTWANNDVITITGTYEAA